MKGGSCSRRFIPLPANGDLEALMREAADASFRGADVYFGLNPRSRRSGTNVDVQFCTGFFVDVDKKELFSRVWALSGTSLEPTAIVSSGHGLHVYWLLEAFTLAYEALETAKRLCLYCASDAVWAPAQTPRLPGTWNWKNGIPTPVQVIAESGRRYVMKDLAAQMQALVPHVPRSVRFRPAQLPKSLSSPVVLPPGTPAKVVWKFANYATQDRSKTDAFLAAWAVEAGWPDEKIARLIASPKHSKLVERMRIAGTQSAERYLASTLTWAHRRVAQRLAMTEQR